MTGSLKKMVFGGPKEEEARVVARRVKVASLKVVVARTCQKRVAKGRGKERKGKCKEGAYPQSGFSASEAPSEESYSQSLEVDDWYSNFTDDPCSTLPKAGHTAWMASLPFNFANHPTFVVLDLGCTRSIASRAAIKRFQKHAWYYGITTEFCPCNKSFVFANSETETCLESCIIIFPAQPPCACDGQRAHLILSFSDEEFGCDYWIA